MFRAFVMAAAVATALLPSVASAATVSVSPNVGVHFVGGPGESNDVTVSFDPTGSRVEDMGAALTVGAGCTPDGPNGAVCVGSGGTLELGDGDDEALVASGFFILNGGDGDDTLDAGTGGYLVNGGPGNDVIFGGGLGGSINSNFRNGGPGDDVIDAEGTPSTLDGGPGADTFTSGGFAQQLLVYSDRTEPVFVDIDDGVGDDGEEDEGDTVGAGISNVVGGSGDDILVGSDAHFEGLGGGGGDDILHGGSGSNDSVGGGDGDDLLIGDLGMNDRLAGGSGIDVADYSDRTVSVSLSPGTGINDGESGEADSIEADVEGLIGGAGADILTAQQQEAFLFGGPGDDQLSGGYFDDLLNGGAGADTLSGGTGFDLSDYSERTSAVFVDLDGQSGDDGEPGEGDTTGGDVEDIGGGSGNDVLSGNGGENFLFGRGGNDSLDGGGASDLLSGGDGDDALMSRDNITDQTDCGDGAGDSATMDWFDDVAGCEQAVGPAPHAATSTASGITQTTARLGAAVNPLGNATTVYWELGPTTAYGTRSDSTSLGPSAPSTTIFTTVSGLTGGTTYHFRVVATNAGGTTYGADVTFTTAAAPPPLPPPPPPRRCVVARVVGQPLGVARRRLTGRLCRIGRITRRPSRVVRAGIVLAQRPRAGRRLPRGSKVSLVVSSGKPRKRSTRR